MPSRRERSSDGPDDRARLSARPPSQGSHAVRRRSPTRARDRWWRWCCAGAGGDFRGLPMASGPRGIAIRSAGTRACSGGVGNILVISREGFGRSAIGLWAAWALAFGGRDGVWRSGWIPCARACSLLAGSASASFAPRSQPVRDQPYLREYTT